MRAAGKATIVLAFLLIACIALIFFQYILLQGKEDKIRKIALENIQLKQELAMLAKQIQSNEDKEKAIEKPDLESEQAFFDKRKYENRDLGISFEYSSDWGEVKYFKLEGEKGISVHLEFNGFPLKLQSNSRDFYDGEADSVLFSNQLFEDDEKFCLSYSAKNDDNVCLASDLSAVDSMLVKDEMVYVFNSESFASDSENAMRIPESDVLAVVKNVSFQKNEYPVLLFYLTSPADAQYRDFRDFIDSLYFIKL